MKRLFIAIDLPDHIKDEIGMICYGLPGAKWIEKDQIHLTLRFIGEVDEATFRDIISTLTDNIDQAFSMRLKGIGFFPPRKTPRVLWVGIENNPKLRHLRNKIENKLTLSDIEPDQRKFLPHVSFARLRDTPSQRLGNYIAGNNLFKTEEFPVDTFHLYSSILTPNGAFHSIEATYALK
jgi:2'-5' RNA ligase